MNGLCKAGIAITAFIVAMGVLAPAFGDPCKTNMKDRLEPPSFNHIFGTDQLGRDVFVRVAFGARTTMILALTISLLSLIVGCLVGAVSGYFGGILDDVIGRIIDTFLAIPSLVFNIALVGIFCAAYGASIWNVVIAIVATNWVTYARVMRGIVMSVKEREFVTCLRAMGAGDMYILFRHVIPNSIGPMIVLSTLNMGSVIMTIASLGFLGLGVQPPTPEWGQMVSAGKDYITTAPWITLFPGLFIALSVLGFNLIGEGLRDELEEGFRIE